MPRDPTTAVGVYRLWRDTGYVVDVLLGGVVADLLDRRAAVVGGLSIVSRLVVASSDTGETVQDCAATRPALDGE